MGDIAFFDKSPYESPPSPLIQQMIAKLAPLGKAVIAARDAEGRWSANIEGTAYVGEDGGDPVLRGKPAPPGECECHIHVRWNEICGYTLKQEDVGYGPEAVIYLLDEQGESAIRIFYPKRTFAEVEATLAGEVPSVEPAPKPYQRVSMIRFKDGGSINMYAEVWKEMSQLIHQETGALGTRLYRVHNEHDELAVIIIAQWTSREARMRALEEIKRKYPADHKIHWLADKFGGKLALSVETDEIGVLP